MYGIPEDLNLEPIVGTETTQIRIGQYDFQFTLGDYSFVIETSFKLLKNREIYKVWEPGKWPDSAFYDIMNVSVKGYSIPSFCEMHIEFENGLLIQLEDNSDRFESFKIYYRNEMPWII